MRRWIPALLVLAATTVSAQTFQWTISNSQTDPYSNSGPIAPGTSRFSGNLYLWMAADNTGLGWTAAEMDILERTGWGELILFTAMNGVLNAGIGTQLQLAVGGCPTTPRLAGAFKVAPDSAVADFEMCIVPSAANNRNITVACGQIPQVLYPNDVVGFRKAAGPVCAPVSVEGRTWGRIKSLYR